MVETHTEKAKRLVDLIKGERPRGLVSRDETDYLNTLDLIEDPYLKRKAILHLVSFGLPQHAKKSIDKLCEISNDRLVAGGLKYIAQEGPANIVKYSMEKLASLTDATISLDELRKVLEGNYPQRVQQEAVRAINRHFPEYTSFPFEQKQEALKLVLEYANPKTARQALDEIMDLPEQAKLNLLLYAGQKAQEGVKKKLARLIQTNKDYFNNLSNRNLRAQIVKFGINNTKQPYNDEFYQMILEVPDSENRLQGLKHVIYNAQVDLAKDALKHHLVNMHNKRAVARALLEITQHGKISVAQIARKNLIKHFDTYLEAADNGLKTKLNRYYSNHNKGSLVQDLEKKFGL